MAKVVEITLGAHKYAVVAQPIAYLEMELGDVFGKLQSVSSPEDLADVVLEQDGTAVVDTPAAGKQGFGELAGPAYAVLKVFIPDLMPEHEARGYASQEAFDAGIRDREAARLTPTLPQVVDAFAAVFTVNRLDIVKHLGKVIPDGLIEKLLASAIGDSVSTLLLSSLPASGESASTTPSEPPPTSASNPD